MTTEVATEDAQSPIAQLLQLGDAHDSMGGRDYLNQLGLSLEHVPELIQIAQNWNLEREDWDTNPAAWAPVHAWRALGQLRATAAIAPLLGLLSTADDDDDWAFEELPDVFGLIGPVALPALTEFLGDQTQSIWSRVAANTGMTKIAEQYPEVRDQSVAAIAHQLEAFAANGAELNGFLVCSLLDLKAAEAAPVMEQAFAANSVDEAFAGDWDDVQVALGLKSPEEIPQPRPRRVPNLLEPPTLEAGPEAPAGIRSNRSQKQKNRAKNKQAKASRQKNRKKRK